MQYQIGELKIEERRPITYRIECPYGNLVRITIEPDPNNDTGGNLTIAGDYGDYSNYWGAMGTGGVIPFLKSLNMDYMAGKLGVEKKFDLEATCLGIKNLIIEQRRTNYVTGEQARSAFDEIESIESERMDSKDAFCYMFWSAHSAFEPFMDSPDLVEDIHPRFKTFFSQVWQPFINDLAARELTTF